MNWYWPAHMDIWIYGWIKTMVGSSWGEEGCRTPRPEPPPPAYSWGAPPLKLPIDFMDTPHPTWIPWLVRPKPSKATNYWYHSQRECNMCIEMLILRCVFEGPSRIHWYLLSKMLTRSRRRATRGFEAPWYKIVRTPTDKSVWGENQ